VRFSPNSSHARLKVEMFMSSEMLMLSPAEAFAVTKIYALSSFNAVWTYTEPNGGWVSLHIMPRVLGISKSKWNKIRFGIKDLFIEDNERWLPAKDWIEYSVGCARPAIPAGIRSTVMHRDKFTCIYCGDTDGPFDIDHIIPISRDGDPLSLDNLACACFRCNRSKGASTPADWLAR
jgi:hypothetical protein